MADGTAHYAEKVGDTQHYFDINIRPQKKKLKKKGPNSIEKGIMYTQHNIKNIKTVILKILKT